MPVISYPSFLPAPDVQGFGYSPQNNKTRTQFESGPARVRRIHRSPTTLFSASNKLTIEQLGVFEYWWASELQDGSQWFELQLNTGSGLQLCQARPVDEYEVKSLSAHVFELTWQLEVRSRPLISADVYYVMRVIGQSEFEAGEDLINQIVNIDLPSDFENA